MAKLHTQILKYTLLPGLLPRFVFLFKSFQSSFAHIAVLMALLFQAVRLLPPDHPYLNPKNAGRFGIRHVMAAAANNLRFSRNNLDQIIIFFTILIGVVLMALQIGLLALALFTSKPVVAMGFTQAFWLSTDADYLAGEQDMVFIMLDKVFGVEMDTMGLRSIYNSCVAKEVACRDLHGNPAMEILPFPYAMHTALHTLLQFFSMGIFIISVLIILYFVATIIGEMAATGTPFGQRINKTWVPIRLIVFAALLIPLNVGGVHGGLNAAQLITFWTAKFGSNFATNAWLRFNDNLTTTLAGDEQKLIARPNIPELNEFIKFMYVAKACKIAHETMHNSLSNGAIQAYIVREKQFAPNMLVPGADAINFLPATFDNALRFSNLGNINIAFGHREPVLNEKYRGAVRPYCGELKLNITSADGPGPVSGSKAIQILYFDMIKDMWQDPEITTYASCEVQRSFQEYQDPLCASVSNPIWAVNKVNSYRQHLKTQIPIAVQQEINNADWTVSNQLKSRGWAGAAIWYNRIAKMNGDVTTAALNIPTPSTYPEIMEYVAEKKTANNEEIDTIARYEPIMAQGDIGLTPEDAPIAYALYRAHRFWEKGVLETPQNKQTNNVVIDAINWVFGSSAIFDMRQNVDIHPLAQLSALGKGLMEASVRNMAIGLAGKFMPKGSFLSSLGSFFQSIGFALILMGFILYYVLPMMPFIYFFFAASGWVKSIFEAIVAMPLWALAHITRIDGEGLPGSAASNGYYLLLEIFIRPITILFGLLASISIFAALVRVMNEIFPLMVNNVTGFSIENYLSGGGGPLINLIRSPIDEFFFTGMYVVLCYMSGLASFKLIDAIPQNLMRWMGLNIQTFHEVIGDPADEIMGKVYKGGAILTGAAQGGSLAALLSK